MIECYMLQTYNLVVSIEVFWKKFIWKLRKSKKWQAKK